MRITGLTLLAAALALTAHAAEPAPNIIPNGNLRYTINGKPAFWTPNPAVKGAVAYLPDGGPDGLPAISIDGTGSMRQHSSLKIVPKEKYRLSARVRLENTNPDGRADIMLINNGWAKSEGIMKIAPSTEWREVSATFSGFPSNNDTWGMVVFGRGLSGKFAVADLKLEALTPTGQAESRPLFSSPGTLESLNTNGVLAADQSDFPDFWANGGGVELRRGAGPGGKNALYLSAANPSATMRQDRAMMLVGGARYRVSMWVKAKNFKARRFSYTLFNDSWGKEGGVLKVPSDCDWTFVEALVYAPRCQKNYGSGLAMRACTSGEILVADLRIEPLDEKSAQGARSLLRGLDQPTWVPLVKLSEISAADPVLASRWFGAKPAGSPEYRVDSGATRMVKPEKDGRIVIRLEGVAPGMHTLEFRWGDYSKKIDFTVIEAIPEVKSIRRNNLVRELPALQLSDGAKGEFVNPRRGWVWFKLPTPAARLTVSGARNPIVGEGAAYLGRGPHSATLTGAAGAVEIRTIPEIFTSQLATGPYIGTQKNTYAQAQKYLLPNITSFIQSERRNISDADLAAIAATGNHQRQSSMHVASPQTVEALIAAVKGNSGVTAPGFDGVAFDEFPAYDLTLMARYNQAHPHLNLPAGRRFYYCLYGIPSSGAVVAEFISNAVNSGAGDGMIKYEAYCQPVPAEKEAAAFIRNIIVEPALSLDRSFPGIVRNLCLYFINCNTPATLTAAYLPDVDLKYYLDMQFNLIANTPELDGLAMTGNWGSNYTDAEMVRWTAALFRHYAIEGRTDMLSKKYGFTYRVEFLRNPDFEDGLNHWQVAGSVETGYTPDYGRKIEKRWAAPRIGDRYAVLTRGAKPNVLSQKLNGVKAGRYYKLQYITSDAEDVLLQKSGRPGDLSVDCEIDGAEFLPELEMQYRARPPFRAVDRDMFKVNVDSRVFKATRDNPELRFIDRAVTPGRKTALNYIHLTPFFTEM